MAVSKDKIIEILKKKFSDSDEDLEDLGTIMDALEGVEKAEALEMQLATMKTENEKALADLDKTWRTRYRERFFNGDVGQLDELIDRVDESEGDKERAEEITLEEYLTQVEEEEKERRNK